MKLIKQMIEKEMELYEEFKLKRYYKRSIWKFYCALNLALSFMKIKMSKKQINNRNRTMSKMLVMDEISDESFKKIEKMIEADSHFIVETLEVLDNVQNTEYQKGDLYTEGMIAISSYEFNT